MWRTSWLSREVIALPLFMLGLLVYGAAHGTGLDGHGGDRRGRRVALRGAFRLHRDGLRVDPLPAGMGQPADRGQLRAVRLRLGLHAGHALAAWRRRARCRAMRWRRLGAHAGGARHPQRLAAAQCPAEAEVHACRLRSASSIRASCRRRRASWAARSTRGSSSTAAAPPGCVASSGPSCCSSSHCPLLCLAAGLSTGSIALLAAAFALQYLGLLAERWFFLAQANHPQNLYYQAIS